MDWRIVIIPTRREILGTGWMDYANQIHGIIVLHEHGSRTALRNIPSENRLVA